MTGPWVVEPGAPLQGVVEVPGDKSVSHRALILGMLARGPSRVRGLVRAGDVDATAAAVRALGAGLRGEGGALVITPPPVPSEPAQVIDCGNSGTSLRLLAGVAASQPFLTVLTGDASLRLRPMDRIADPLRRMGASVDGRDGGRLAPLVIRGGDLRMAQHDLTIASAQVKSAVLLAGLRSGVAVREPRQSRDHTERLLTAMGASLRRAPQGWLVLLPGPLEPFDLVVPGDVSSAAFWMVAAAIVPGSEVILPSVGVNPTRVGVIDALIAMGADLTVSDSAVGVEPIAQVRVRFGALHGTRIAGELALRCLDELPVLAVAAAVAEGETVIADAEELRVKESDRIVRVVRGLRALGVDVDERPDGMVIRGGRLRGPASIDASHDHRIAMAFAVAGLVSPGGVVIEGADTVGSSYPGFRAQLESLRA